MRPSTPRPWHISRYGLARGAATGFPLGNSARSRSNAVGWRQNMVDLTPLISLQRIPPSNALNCITTMCTGSAKRLSIRSMAVMRHSRGAARRYHDDSTNLAAQQQKNLPMSLRTAIARTASRGLNASLALRGGHRLCCNLEIPGTDSHVRRRSGYLRCLDRHDALVHFGDNDGGGAWRSDLAICAWAPVGVCRQRPRRLSRPAGGNRARPRRWPDR